MQLFYSATSPYVRKVVVAAMLRGLDDRLERVTVNAHASPPALLAANPLSKVPALITDDGRSLVDSPVICAFLDSLGEAPPLTPAGPDRWRVERLHALADGITDAAVLGRMEAMRPEEAARGEHRARLWSAVVRTLDLLEGEAAMLDEATTPAQWTIGTVALACALGYLDFRYGDRDWRAGRPGLAAWDEAVRRHPVFVATEPA
ncbi:glutathione S-transferase N-terminal domain-containing protein [Parapedomonas caeni]